MIIGVYCSLFLYIFAGVSNGFIQRPEPKVFARIEAQEFDDSKLFSDITEDNSDIILEHFRNPEYSEWVINFFSGICLNADIAQAILNSSDNFNISPALTFALCWEESRFNPNAINRQNRNGSIDRGLFQLNDRSFPNLEIITFYNINHNAHHGIGYLRHCLDSSDSIISALAMYNAGAGRIKSTGAPEVTLNYISRILDNRDKIESRFNSRLIYENEMRFITASR